MWYNIRIFYKGGVHFMSKNGNHTQKLYDWETDEELCSDSDDQIGWIHAGIIAAVTFMCIVMLNLVTYNYFFGPRTYLVSYNYATEQPSLFWGAGQTFILYDAEVKTDNCRSFIVEATDEIVEDLYRKYGGKYQVVITSYQKVPRTVKDLLRFD